MTITVELEDTDALGVIYGPRILVWTSRIFQRSLTQHGVKLKALIDEEIHLPIFKSSCEILLPLQLEDVINTQLIITERRKRSFAFAVAFYRGPALAARGEMVHVCIDAKSREKKLLPPAIERWLDALAHSDSA